MKITKTISRVELEEEELLVLEHAYNILHTLRCKLFEFDDQSDYIFSNQDIINDLHEEVEDIYSCY